MGWGIENRLNKLILPDGKCFFLPIDHGYFQGPTSCLERPGDTIKPILSYCDALFVTRGVLRAAINPVDSKPIILRVSGGTSVVGGDLANEGLTTSIKDAVRLNVSGVGLSVFIGSDYERQTLLNLGKLVDECEEYGIPVMAVTAVGKELEKRDARYLSLCCRIAAELGAKVVKTYWCEDFEKVTTGCPAPIVIAGGPKLETEMDVFELTYNALQQGAVGVDMGRNIWQNDHPVAIIRAIRSIVHEGLKPKQAHEFFKEIKEEQTKKVASG